MGSVAAAGIPDRTPMANRRLKSRSPSSRSLKLSGGGQPTLCFSTGQICTSRASHEPDLIRSRRLPCIASDLRFTGKSCMTSLPMTNVVAHPSSSGFVAVGSETWSFLASPCRLLLLQASPGESKHQESTNMRNCPKDRPRSRCDSSCNRRKAPVNITSRQGTALPRGSSNPRNL
jgi:hypothetical protein